MKTRKQMSWRFDPENVERWKAKAESEGVSLTRWVEESLSMEDSAMWRLLMRIERKLDEVLEDFVEWED